MSVPLRVSTKLPETHELNGLLELLSRFRRADASSSVLAVVRLDVVRLVTRIEDGLVVPTIEIKEAEPEGRGLPAARLRDLLDQARHARNDVPTLPHMGIEGLSL